MKKRIRILAVLLSLLLLSGCGKSETSDNKDAQTNQETTGEAEGDIQSGSALDISEMFSERDYETDYDESQSISIMLNGDSAECNSDAVHISNSTITISDEGTYILSGTLNNGMIIINADKTDKLQLVLNGTTINSDTSAAIYVAQADKVFLTLASGSENTFSNGGSFEAIDDNNIDAVIFAKDDLTLNGQGSLNVQSPAGHGIVSKDDLVVTGGEYTIDAENHGLCGKESVRIADGTFTIISGKDGIHAEDADDTLLGFGYFSGGVYNISADGDGISTSNILQIEEGSYTVKTGGGSDTVNQDEEGNWDWERPDRQQSTDTTEETVSAKGIKASGSLLIANGSFSVDSADDAFHSNSDLTVKGGDFEIATGDDGVHADETVYVADGTVTILKSYEGIEGQNITISGGIISLISSDDGLNAAGGNDQSGNGGFGGFQDNGGVDEASDSAITISGGKLLINASGDGVDSNGSLNVSGGETYVSGPTNSGNGALDYNGEATISGGIFVAAGPAGMAQNFGSSSTQGAMLVSISSNSDNSTIILENDSAENLLNCTVEKNFDCVLISCPEIKQGETYTVSVGESSEEVTMSSLIYGSGGMGEKPDGNGKPDMMEKPD